jgi:hypothetical protein
LIQVVSVNSNVAAMMMGPPMQPQPVIADVVWANTPGAPEPSASRTAIK